MQADAKQGYGCPYLIKDRAPGGAWHASLPTLLGALLALLLASGAVLAVYYNPRDAYGAVQMINREVNGGWLVLGYHNTGASLAFLALYAQLFRLLLTRSYRAPARFAWMLWVKLLAVLLLTGWLGFVLQGGAGGALSLTHASDAALTLPGFPGAVALWIFGGPAGPGTLARLLVFHVVLAACAVGVICWARCTARRARPAPEGRAVAFWPVYASQYFAALAALALLFTLLLAFAPHWGQSAQAMLPGDALPVVISYPWYLRPVAHLATLIPGDGGAILVVILAAATLYALPWLDRSNGAPPGRLYRWLTLLLGLDVLALGCASAPVQQIIFGIWFFIHFLVLTPLVTAAEAK